MFLSMTGYSNKTVVLPIGKKDKILLEIELKSINSRFFELVSKLPSFLSSSELKISQALKEKLLRGRVYLNVKIEDDLGLFEKVHPAYGLMQSYIDAVNQIKKKFKIQGDFQLKDLLDLPNVFVPSKSELSPDLEKIILKAILNVADGLMKSRSLEGNNLKKDFNKSFDICSKKIKQIEELFVKLIKSKKEEIKSTLAAYQQNADEQLKMKLDDLYSSLNKIDIHEEIIRFNSHLERVKQIIKDKSVEKGKQIDFVLQEMMRESNTILAKCSSFEISSGSVDIKVEIEKVREQVQNVV